MDLAPDFDEFIGSLIVHGAEFLIVGAYALAFHGAPRFTGDLDILIRPTVEDMRHSKLATTLEKRARSSMSPCSRSWTRP